MKITKSPITIAKNAAPSINAAIKIMLDLRSFVASGCLAIACIAPFPMWPIPKPAPKAAILLQLQLYHIQKYQLQVKLLKVPFL